MGQHQDHRDQSRGYPDRRRSSGDSSESRREPQASQQNTHYGNQGNPDNRPQPFWEDNQGYPDKHGQEGQYGTSPENRYGNSPTNPYAKNPGGSADMGEPWRDEPYGESHYRDADFSGGNRPDPSQYAGGGYQGYREQGGYPVGNYDSGAENYRSGGYQGGGGIYQGTYEDSGGRGYQHDSQQNRPRHGNQEEQRSRGHGEWDHDQFDPHYRQWRAEQIQKLDEDYRAWRTEYYGRFSDEFSEWRRKRHDSGDKANPNKPTGGASAATPSAEGKLKPRDGNSDK